MEIIPLILIVMLPLFVGGVLAIGLFIIKGRRLKAGKRDDR